MESRRRLVASEYHHHEPTVAFSDRTDVITIILFVNNNHNQFLYSYRVCLRPGFCRSRMLPPQPCQINVGLLS